MFGRTNGMSDKELDDHLSERLPLLAAEARAARAAGNKSVEESTNETINVALDRMAKRKGWRS